MAPVCLQDGSPCQEGRALLRQMVLARAFPDVDVCQRLQRVSEVFDRVETLDRLCAVSGGHVRNLLVLLYGCLQRKDPPLSRDCLENVIRQRRSELLLAVTQDEITLLRQVAQHKNVRGEAGYQTLLHSMFVFEYKNNDGNWFDINPILAEAKEFQL